MLGTKLALRYELVSELGRGGMGVVYRATDPVLNRGVAVKLIPPTLLTPESETRFRNEAQIVAQMDHPSIVPIHDLGVHEGSLFFVMPIAEGQSLRAPIKARELSLGDILDVGIQVAEALDYAHTRGIVHRDIKPENIMVTREEGRLRVRVMDFGLARMESETTGITKTGTLVGTMAYLSPEQVSGRLVDGRSDLYSLATVLYECFAGTVPFAGELQSILYRIVHEVPQSLRARGVDVAEEVDALIQTCLAKSAEQRPETGADIARRLRSARESLRESERNRTVFVSHPLTPARAALSPFVGRRREIEELQSRLNASVQGECQFVVVSGEQGVGKTRLLDELEELARARKLPVLHGRFLEQDRSFPFNGFCEAIQEHFRNQEGSGDSPSVDLSDLADELVALFPVLGEIHEIQSSASGSALTPGAVRTPENRTEVFEVLARTFTRLAAGRPLLLFFEELHAADVSLEALEYIVRRLGPTPTLVIGTYRSGDIDRSHPLVAMLRGFEGDRRFAQLALGPLTESEYGRFVSTLVGGNDVDSGLIRRLYEGTEGNPFFTKEMVRTLLDSGGMSRAGTGVWSLSSEAGLTAETMPATIQQAVEKRIERLPEALREIVSVAAVIGKSFDFEDLEALLPDEESLDDAADSLIRDGVLEEDRKSRGDRLAFTSGVVRDVLYAGLSRRRRRSLHRKVAARLEKRHENRMERVLPDLLYHFSEGDEPEKSVEYGLLLARRSLETFSADEALHAAKTALEFLDEEWEGEESVKGEARWLLSRAYHLRGDRMAAAREAEAAVAVFQKTGQTARAADALLVAAQAAWEDRRTEDAERTLEQGLVAARAAGAPETLRELLTLAATMAGLRGEYERANELYSEVERLAGSDSPAAESEDVPRGGRLVVAMSNALHAHDFADTRLDEEVEIWSNVFENLVGSDDRGNPIPLLAESWTVVEEGRVFRFRLRSGIAFHDGTPLDAPAVKACFEETACRSAESLPAVLAPIEGMSAFLENGGGGLAGLRVLGDRELEIRLRESIPIFPALLRHNSAFVARTGAEGGTRTIGTGPFRFVSSDDGKVVVERNDAYWGETVPRGDALEFRLGLTGREMASRIRSGEIDVARNLAAEELEELQREPRFRSRLVEMPGKNTTFLLFNTKTGPVARDERIRRALSGVLRVRDLVWRTRGANAEPAACLICPGLLGHDPGRRRKELNVAEAARVLEEAAPASRTLRVLASPAAQDRLAHLVRELFARWAELGVEAELVPRTHEEFVESVKSPDGFDVLLGGWIADYDDPDAFTHALFDSQGGTYRGFYGSEEIDETFAKARAETRPSVRETLYRHFEARLQDEAVLVPLFHEVVYRLPGPKVRGLRMRNHPPYSNYAEAGKAESDLARAAADTASGTIRVPFVGPINSTLDPREIRFVNEVEISSCVFEPLTRAEGARVVPWLVSEIRTENEGRRYVLRLRRDVRFHDGRRLTARDVRFTLERVLAEENEVRGGLAGIVGARKVMRGEDRALEGFRISSSEEFSIDLERPSSFFPAVLSQQGLGILPEGAEFGGRSWKQGIVGTGPFRVAHFVPGERVEMERNPSYWRPGVPHCRNLVMASCESPEQMVSGFREGKYTLIDNWGTQDLEELRRDPELASGFHQSPSLGVIYLAMQTREGPLADPAARRRIVDGIDFAGIVRELGLDSGRTAQGLIPPGLLKLEVAPGASRGTGGAAAGPAAAAENVRLRLVCSPTFARLRHELIAALTEAFAGLGYRLERVCSTDAEYNAAVSSGAGDLVVAGWSADFPDIHAIAYTLLHSRDGYLRNVCGSPEIDELLDRAGAETDTGTRHSLYRRVEEMVAKDARAVPLFYLQTARYARPELEGVKLAYSGPYVAYENLRLRA